MINRIFFLKRDMLIPILFGIFLCAVFFTSPGFILIATLFIAILFFIKYYLKTDSRAFLINLFIIGFILRLILSGLNYCLPLKFGVGGYKASDTQPDAIIYNGYAVYIAESISGRDFSQNLNQDKWLDKVVKNARQRFKGKINIEYQTGAYVMMLGTFYSWLGYSPVSAKLLNSIIGCLNAILVYYIVRTLLRHEPVAKMSAVFTMFLPSLVYWSCSLLQDTICLFLYLLFILCALFFFTNKRILFFINCLLISFVIFIFKPKFLPLLILANVALLIMFFYRALVRRLRPFYKIVISLGLAIFLISQAGLIDSLLLKTARQAVLTHIGYATSSSNLVYNLYPKRFYDTSNIKINDVLSLNYFFIILKAIFYFLFSPFPWKIPTKNILIFYPQIIFTFFCIPIMIRGLILGLANNFNKVFFLIVLSTIFLIPLSLSSGLSGITFRHKDLFMPIFFIFVSTGMLWETKKNIFLCSN